MNRAAPVCRMGSAVGTAEPVRMKRPGLWREVDLPACQVPDLGDDLPFVEEARARPGQQQTRIDLGGHLRLRRVEQRVGRCVRETRHGLAATTRAFQNGCAGRLEHANHERVYGARKIADARDLAGVHGASLDAFRGAQRPCWGICRA